MEAEVSRVNGGVGARGDALEGEKVTFEEAFQELEATVQRLEAGDLPIDEMVALFERGMRLAQLCNARLDAAELRVGQLAPRADGGTEVVPFDV